MISNGNKKIIRNVKLFIVKYKLKAKRHRYDYNDDLKCFKMIYVIATVFPVNDKYYRNIPEIELQLKDLWYLYFYYKYRINGQNHTYSQIVSKYA